MKNFLFVSVFTFALSISAFSQERPRYFDNFDSSAGVKVVYPPSPVTTYNGLTLSPGKKESDVEPRQVVDRRLVKKTVIATMTVYDGNTLRETPAVVSAPSLTMGAGKYLRGYSTGDQLIDSYIVDSSRRYDIDPLLIYSQMNQESSFKIRATSNKGASGLMQLMPATARRMGVTKIYDPQQNIEGGVKYMRLLLDMFNGDVNLALAGYNAGEGAVVKFGYQIPPYSETQDYVRRISARYRSISYGTTAKQNSTLR